MNDNENKDPKAPDAELPPSTDLALSFQLGVRVNMDLNDPNFKDVFMGEDFKAFIDGPLAVLIFTSVQQFCIAKCAHMVMTLPNKPAEKMN